MTIKKPIYYDIESYPDYFLLTIYNPESDKYTHIDSTQSDFVMRIRAVCTSDRYDMYSFNGSAYDDIVLSWIMLRPGITPQDIKAFSDKVIKAKHIQDLHLDDKTSLLYHTGWTRCNIRHTPSLITGSLKIIASRLGYVSPHAVMKSYPFDKPVTHIPGAVDDIKAYCASDCKSLWYIATHPTIKPGIDAYIYATSLAKPGSCMRILPSGKICNLMMGGKVPASLHKSKYDAEATLYTLYPQTIALMAECPAVKELYDTQIRPYLKTESTWIKKSAPLTIHGYGVPISISTGGIHSVNDVCKYTTKLYDYDITSFYPNLMILSTPDYDKFAIPAECAHYPRKLKALIDERVACKKSNPIKSAALKIVINSVYGILGSEPRPYDVTGLRSKLQANSICINGQMQMLCLIDMAKAYDVIYVNTDGITTRQPIPDSVISRFQQITGLTIESSSYDKTVIHHVNEYIALKSDHEDYKVKGSAFTRSLGATQSLYTQSLVAHKAIDVKAIAEPTAADLVMYKPIYDPFTGTQHKDLVYYSKTGYIPMAIAKYSDMTLKKGSKYKIRPITEYTPDDVDHDSYRTEASYKTPTIGKICITIREDISRLKFSHIYFDTYSDLKAYVDNMYHTIYDRKSDMTAIYPGEIYFKSDGTIDKIRAIHMVTYDIDTPIDDDTCDMIHGLLQSMPSKPMYTMVPSYSAGGKYHLHIYDPISCANDIPKMTIGAKLHTILWRTLSQYDTKRGLWGCIPCDAASSRITQACFMGCKP